MAWWLIPACFESLAARFLEKTFSKSAYLDGIKAKALSAFKKAIWVLKKG